MSRKTTLFPIFTMIPSFPVPYEIAKRFRVRGERRGNGTRATIDAIRYERREYGARERVISGYKVKGIQLTVWRWIDGWINGSGRGVRGIHAHQAIVEDASTTKRRSRRVRHARRVQYA